MYAGDRAAETYECRIHSRPGRSNREEIVRVEDASVPRTEDALISKVSFELIFVQAFRTRLEQCAAQFSGPVDTRNLLALCRCALATDVIMLHLNETVARSINAAHCA